MNLDAKLTKRQLKILELLSLGYAEKEIACELGVSTRTIDNTICKIKEKINVHKATELTLFYLSRRFGFSFIISDKTKRAVSFCLILLIAFDSFLATTPGNLQNFTAVRRINSQTSCRIIGRTRKTEFLY